MAEAFVGTWKLVKSDKFDDYMKVLGVGMAMRAVGNRVKPNITIKVEGNKVVITSTSTFKTTVISCTLGEEFDETTADERKVKSVISVEDGKLVHIQKWDDKETSLVRAVNGNELTLTLTFGDVTSTRNYEKVE